VSHGRGSLLLLDLARSSEPSPELIHSPFVSHTDGGGATRVGDGAFPLVERVRSFLRPAAHGGHGSTSELRVLGERRWRADALEPRRGVGDPATERVEHHDLELELEDVIRRTVTRSRQRVPEDLGGTSLRSGVDEDGRGREQERVLRRRVEPGGVEEDRRGDAPVARPAPRPPVLLEQAERV
jgi:hypothetical protein